jgi:1,4-dihydroxy-2-naphthoate octaprenyltransferase
MQDRDPATTFDMKTLRLFLKLSRPVFLLGGALVFGLGAAIASFQDYPIDLGRYLIGQGMITFIQLMTQYLNEYYGADADRENPNRTPFSGGSGVLGPDGLPRQVALYAAAACVAIAGTLASVSVFRNLFPLVAWLILVLIFIGAFYYNVPPIRLIRSGYGEITTSTIVALLVPSFSFAAQSGKVDRLLLMSTIPLVALHFAMMIVLQLPDYASDLKHDKHTLMVRLGWSTTMRLHDFAIIFAIIFLGVASFYTIPLRVALGSLIALPLALAQIWQMQRIRRGYPVRWRILTFSAVGLFSLAVYLQLIGYLYT